MSSPLTFPLTEVKENGEMAVRVEAPSDLFAGALTEGALVGPVAVEGTIRQVDDQASFEGTARGRWRFECTRCLKPVDGDWNERVEAAAPIDGGPMDLTEDVRQAVGLAEPMKVLCRPDCKGLCSVCRADRNVKDCGHALGEAEASRRPRLTPRPDKK